MLKLREYSVGTTAPPVVRDLSPHSGVYFPIPLLGGVARGTSDGVVSSYIKIFFKKNKRCNKM